ncbi:antibiotic biosynthesis monooxygenase [Bacillus sp. V3B]|uniref:antibiotic biosynthesis monooxygenase family protein n=1 Tax=Bacillus sp. V3B TaxID=2804915 RepID=UPI00210B50E5|nr:antibiotic biosynthesis monooxygenase [Bacillus sp. V3B]MCQ6273408.1 antibiotic biosynthesis monooxygenase [Bacillus sp. V3B]
MKMFFTNGTREYLKKIVEEHEDETLVLMQNEHASLLIHETVGDSLFKEPRKYEVVDASGQLTDVGFAVFNHIPVTDEGRPLFEYRFKNRDDLIEKQPGFIAIRVLRPLSSDTYIIFTLWENESSFKNWQTSNSFEQVYSNKDVKKGAKKQPKIFPRPSFVTKYSIVIEED